MATVTSRINEIKQPRGGYIKISDFSKTILDDGKKLSESENIHWTIMGLVVDYLTRYIITNDVEEAFDISKKGYDVKKLFCGERTINHDIQRGEDIDSLLGQIHGLDDNSIISACKACTYDTWYRNPGFAFSSKSPSDVYPDDNTIENIRIMVNRSAIFWNKYGEIVASGFTFKSETDEDKNGYSSVVTGGDGDYLTKDTIWDFKVSKAKPTSKNTLQLLMYWIMGRHSKMDIFKDITRLGFFNPRLNIVYTLDTAKISSEIINIIENEVICY